jgi:hypothetical protein
MLHSSIIPIFLDTSWVLNSQVRKISLVGFKSFAWNSTKHKSILLIQRSSNSPNLFLLTEIGPANMWTLTNIKSFKEHIRKEGGDAIIKIGHGETVTVIIPSSLS